MLKKPHSRFERLNTRNTKPYRLDRLNTKEKKKIVLLPLRGIFEGVLSPSKL
nr:MAG TPA: hypothetical protein [Caudoviricetes sp.]